MTSPLRVMIDTPVAYKLATDPNAEPLMRDAVRSGRLVLVAPHFQRYQVERVPGEERDMVVKFVANLTLQTKTAGLILDFEQPGEARRCRATTQRIAATRNPMRAEWSRGRAHACVAPLAPGQSSPAPSASRQVAWQRCIRDRLNALAAGSVTGRTE